MTRQYLSRATGLVTRSLRSSSIRATRIAPRLVAITSTRTFLVPTIALQSRFISTSRPHSKGILPDTDDPAPPNVQDSGVKPVPAELNDTAYHELADEYLAIIQDRLEEIAERNDQVDVEYSVWHRPTPSPPSIHPPIHP